ncbi:hypothetical protein Cycma_1843 [Cyclobacterium marinum DSM 745]|uniref:Uncharacterized protein n=1 Tax=Cyclobacterium marinum (strain ATCC 25205 / DSM 745 / LMG 13164 / NCIMB 1802) TaxID=880070 RepID=G0IX47_CYCMS|nr:hypothetical protein Cycma_1843 [Cyclobacterium marinum DSM 745]
MVLDIIKVTIFFITSGYSTHSGVEKKTWPLFPRVSPVAIVGEALQASLYS